MYIVSSLIELHVQLECILQSVTDFRTGKMTRHEFSKLFEIVGQFGNGLGHLRVKSLVSIHCVQRTM